MSKRLLSGIIASIIQPATAVVEVKTAKVHRRYGKRYRSTKKYKADMRDNKVNVGDRVLIEEHSPISKTKKWIVKSYEQLSSSPGHVQQKIHAESAKKRSKAKRSVKKTGE